MKLAECKQLQSGDPVRVSLGGGWWVTGKFKGVYKVTSYGTATIDTIDRINWNNGRTEWLAFYEYEEDGHRREGSCYPRAMQRG